MIIMIHGPHAHWSVRFNRIVYKVPASLLYTLTTLALWLRSSVVSVLDSLTTIMEARLFWLSYFCRLRSVGSACTPWT
jgi:hypothetical protein